MDVLVTGGTGALGRQVVMLLRQSGHRARIFSRNPRGHVDAVRGDLRTGEGLDRAVAGMEVIVHAASATRQPLRQRSTDVRGTRRLLERARAANIQHVVFISIVGVDRVAYPYYRTKLAAEAVIKAGDVPWSILHATQFHGFVELLLAGFSRLPGLCTVPLAWKLQPVETLEVAHRVVAVALAPPAGTLPDFGGPEVRDFKSLAEAWLGARREQRRIVNLPLPLKFSRQVAEGGLTCPEHRDGTATFDEYLTERYGST